MRTLHFQRLLGSGAFGSVYLADMAADRGFRRQVAVKVLLKDHGHGDMFMSRVRDEARLLGLLADDHILKVMELVRVEGRDAVVMEYVEGVDLNAIVEAGLRPPPRALAELGAAVAGALHRAHKAVHPNTGEPLNVIHRDVKPANVMITSRGGVKLLDFGVARARFEARESFTGQFVLGTLNYMAPEYIVTGEVSPAADIYGLALTLWEAACGEVFGQPKLRQDLHLARIEERLEVIAGTHAELVPVLRQMLGWEARGRPDGAAIERAFMAATDMLRGTGLRTWAGEAVPKVLAREREAARDEVGLLGKTVAIGDAEGLPGDGSKVGPRPEMAPVSASTSGGHATAGAGLPGAGSSVSVGVAPTTSGATTSGARASAASTGSASGGAASGGAGSGRATSGASQEPSEATIHHSSRPAFLEDARSPSTSGARATNTSGGLPEGRSAVGSPSSTGAMRRPSPGALPAGGTTGGTKRTRGTSWNMLLLQGLVLGAGVCFLLLFTIIALLVVRGLS